MCQQLKMLSFILYLDIFVFSQLVRVKYTQEGLICDLIAKGESILATNIRMSLNLCKEYLSKAFTNWVHFVWQLSNLYIICAKRV